MMLDSVKNKENEERPMCWGCASLTLRYVPSLLARAAVWAKSGRGAGFAKFYGFILKTPS